MFLPCDPPQIIACSERFCVSASQWIDATNFGYMPHGMQPPAGIRLRWNCPLNPTANPDGKAIYPDRFIVLRSESLPPEMLLDPLPNVGHLPRMLAPRPLWNSLVRSNPREFVVAGGKCKGAQAVRIEMSPHGSHPVSIALIDTGGRVQLTGELVPGDSFYYEIADLHRVSFSAPPRLKTIEGLSLLAEDINKIDLPFRKIAEIDARAWLGASFQEIGERMTANGQPPFVTITKEDWSELQQRANVLVDAIDKGAPIPMHDQTYVELALASRWETAVLAGTGFFDGEHISTPKLDSITASVMLSWSSNDEVFGYQIVAQFDGEDLAVHSDAAFARAQMMDQLPEANVSQISMPRTRLVQVNQIDQTGNGETPKPNDPVPRAICSTSWLIETDAPYAEIVFTTPQATKSQITGDDYQDPSEFRTNAGAIAPWFRGFRRFERRDHSFNVPYYDSKIWLALAVGDCWDRRIDQDPTSRVQPQIDYEGLCLELTSGSCKPPHDNKDGIAELVLKADSVWTADLLATHAHGRIEFLIKNPVVELQMANVKLFSPTLAPDGNWRAEFESNLDKDLLSRLVGGTLAIDGFKARILGIGPANHGRYRCDFEAVAQCAGAELYKVGPSGIAARLYEEDGADRVWDVAGSTPLQTDGTPLSFTHSVKLPVLDTSMTLYFATRLAFDFDGGSYRGPTTARISVPYLHPAPDPPKQCVAIETLATDYYGRTLIRVATTECDQFDPTLEATLELAEGLVDDKTFSETSSSGHFGPQSPFYHRVLFDGFDLLSLQPEGRIMTLGLRYYRTSDGRESLPFLSHFPKRRTD